MPYARVRRPSTSVASPTPSAAEQGNSLGLNGTLYPGGNVLTVNQSLNLAGQFMVSTYSPPDPKEYALYQRQANGAFAQCNGARRYGVQGLPALGPK
jgi:hypothetical protein